MYINEKGIHHYIFKEKVYSVYILFKIYSFIPIDFIYIFNLK